MAITRSVTTLLPAAELVAIRTRLADHYGSELHDADDRHILCIHVPRPEPDPVNDVEAAVEYLDPGDVEAATHVLLIGTDQMAQVYVEPFKHLLAERVLMDERIAREWGQRLPGTLSHQFFRDPGDPRRSWRLAVRLPVETLDEAEDDTLEPLADELGPQLETPRMRGLAAVYLIAGRDHVRLAPDLFVQELLKTWRDEERRRRIIADRERIVQQERERKEHERRKLMAELDRTLATRVARAPLRSHPISSQLDADELPPGTRLTPTRDRQQDPEEGPLGASAEYTASRSDRDRPSFDAERGVRSDTRPRPSPEAGAREGTRRVSSEALLDIDEVIEARSAGGARTQTRTASSQSRTTGATAPVMAHQDRVRHIRDKLDGLGRRAHELNDRPGGRLGRIAQHLMDCGFDVLVRPETHGPRIDLAAERPEGDPGRIVVRVEDQLTADAADQALVLARTLKVDQVVVVSETAEPEAERRLLATKVQWLTPSDLAAARL